MPSSSRKLPVLTIRSVLVQKMSGQAFQQIPFPSLLFSSVQRGKRPSKLVRPCLLGAQPVFCKTNTAQNGRATWVRVM